MYYVEEQLSKNRSRTREGYLLITGTPIARTGIQLYGPEETPIKGVNGGAVKIERNEDEVFRPATVFSANGKSLVNDHPEDDVTPLDWQEKTLGILLNPRRGEGLEDDLLIVDILVTTQEGIELIESGKVELSCGYDAQYEELGSGHGRQYNIVINHAALVDKGRCGTRCSIRDGDTMAKKVRTTWDRMLQVWGVKDEAELKEKLEGVEDAAVTEEEGGDHTHVHVHMGEMTGDRKAKDEEPVVETSDEKPTWFKDFEGKYEKDMATVRDSIATLNTAGAGKALDEETEGDLKEEAPAGTSDAAFKVNDSVILGDSFQETAALAEIIAPGIAIPTFDRASPPKKTLDSICALRVRALDLAYHQPDTRSMMDELLAGKTFDAKMPCGEARTLFRSVGALKRIANNNGSRAARDNTAATPVKLGGIRSMKDLNAYHADFYGKQG